jgi:hypothetical protein
MIPKSGYRFSEKIMLQQEDRAGWRFEEKSSRLEHDPEKWIPVFGKDHAPARRQSGMAIPRKVIAL